MKINKILDKIESKREDNNLFWEIIIKIKDFFWMIYSCLLGHIPSYIKNFFYKTKLPDFLIIGAQKSGTGILWKLLEIHPQINVASPFFGNKKRELHFFDVDNKWKKGPGWYKRHFVDNGKLCGEKTPEYIYKKEAHKRMHNIVPQAKLILILRNPIDRAYSQWKMYNSPIEYIYFNDNVKRNKSDRPFWLQPFEEVIKYINREPVDRGFYIDQIKNLLKFYSRKQLLIIIFEKMEKNFQKTLDDISNFLGVEKNNININKMLNKMEKKYKLAIEKLSQADYNNWDRKKIQSKKTKEILYKIYEPYNKKLFDFLGYKIKEWELKE